MPSTRRMRVFSVVVFAIVIYILYITSNTRATHNSPDFYSKTKKALDRERGSYKPHQAVPPSGNDEEDAALAASMASRLRDAESIAKDTANAKAPRPGGSGEQKASSADQESASSEKAGADRNVAGRKKYPIDDSQSQKPIEKETDEEHEVEVVLNDILKRSPIIIFSKTYCPHSRRAKEILLERYSIIPAPYVVELDEHPIGASLQAKLAGTTGRRTVPNVLVNGKSIGGGDDIAALDEEKTLIDKLKSMGGKRMQEVRLRSG